MSRRQYQAQRLDQLRPTAPDGPARPAAAQVHRPDPPPDSPAIPLPWLSAESSRLDPELLAAAQAIVAPIYRQLVTAVEDALEKSLGLSLAYLAWIELVKQFEIQKQLIETAELGLPARTELNIQLPLRLIDTKIRLSRLLVRCREVHSAPAPARAPAGIVADSPPAAPRSSAARPTAAAADPFSAPALAKAGVSRESTLAILRHFQQKVAAGLANLEASPQPTPPATHAPLSPEPAPESLRTPNSL